MPMKANGVKKPKSTIMRHFFIFASLMGTPIMSENRQIAPMARYAGRAKKKANVQKTTATVSMSKRNDGEYLP